MMAEDPNKPAKEQPTEVITKAGSAVDAKMQELRRSIENKTQRKNAVKQQLVEKGATLFDQDIKVVNVQLRMPASAFLLGTAVLHFGGSAVPDTPRADTDPDDSVTADNDPMFPKGDSDPSDF